MSLEQLSIRENWPCHPLSLPAKKGRTWSNGETRILQEPHKSPASWSIEETGTEQMSSSRNRSFPARLQIGPRKIPKSRQIYSMDHDPIPSLNGPHCATRILETNLRPIQNQIVKWLWRSSRAFGLIKIFSPTDRFFHFERNGHRSKDLETIIVFHPAPWLLSLGMMYGWRLVMNQSQQGWKYCLNQFRAVPDNALIFELSRQGNIMAAETLIRRGEASVWDTDSRGRTPLHVGYAIHCLRNNLAARSDSVLCSSR